MRTEFYSQRVHWLPRIAVAVLASAWSCDTATAQGSDAANARLIQRLEQPVTATWQGQQLARALDGLGETQRIAVWLDRRVDPSAPVDLSVSGQPLGEAIAALVRPHRCAAAPYHGVLYVGPEQIAGELLTLSALARRSLNRAPADVRSRWLRAEPWSFPRFSEPRALLVELVKSAGAQVHDDRLVPHDLWPARTLPPMATLDRVVLLLSGFDLTCEMSADGRRCRVVPIKRPVHIAADYTVGDRSAAAVDALLRQLPAAKATRRGAKLTLAATVQEHDRVRAAIRGEAPKERRPRSTPPAASRDAQRFTLKIINQPVGPVVDQLARQLKLNIEWTAGATARNTLVSCEVREATLDELLAAVLSPAGLAFERDDQAVNIKPAD